MKVEDGKMKKIVFCLMIIGICSVSHAYVYSDYEWFNYNGHQYALTIQHNTWSGCEAEAVAQGGHLVTINDSAEHQWLLDESPLCSSYAIGYPGDPGHNGSWIGMYYDGVGNIHSLDSWVWLTGEVGSDFLVTAPSFYSYHGNHMIMTGTYHPEHGMITNAPHHDIYRSEYSQGIIEIPEPATLSLLALGGMALLRKRK